MDDRNRSTEWRTDGADSLDRRAYLRLVAAIVGLAMVIAGSVRRVDRNPDSYGRGGYGESGYGT